LLQHDHDGDCDDEQRGKSGSAPAASLMVSWSTSIQGYRHKPQPVITETAAITAKTPAAQ
jgi:hypothetical protein